MAGMVLLDVLACGASGVSGAAGFPLIWQIGCVPAAVDQSTLHN
jgi:hypothetical protein